MDIHTKGWERSREMRKWRKRKGGQKEGSHACARGNTNYTEIWLHPSNR